jgi:DNA helicase HerA-like ATPase
MTTAQSMFLGATCKNDGQPLSARHELRNHHLLTHGVVLGMTGSSKTGLLHVMYEEALGAGVPVLMIDVKGDLPNLLLSFPPPSVSATLRHGASGSLSLKVTLRARAFV